MNKGKSFTGIYFTADTHFGHTNIIKYCNRPFRTVQEMDAILIDNINQTVGVNDTLYHLGDFSFKNCNFYRDRIACQNIILIKGNHDKEKPYLYRHTFPEVCQYKEIKINGVSITLNHYAMSIWNKRHYGSFQLYGHSHGNFRSNGRQMDVGVDTNKFFPYAWEEIYEKLSKITNYAVDHHI